MDAAKISLSPEESALVVRADWILTKNAILQKVRLLLEQVQSLQAPRLADLPAAVLQPAPKISKGENYRGLPYLVLDQPRYFNREDIFAIRALFWWGHFFSNTLHLAGSYKKVYEQTIIEAFPFWQEAGFYAAIHPDPWQHHFEPDNFIPVQELTASRFERIIQDSSFIKLSKKIPLEQWDDAAEGLVEITGQLASVLTD